MQLCTNDEFVNVFGIFFVYSPVSILDISDLKYIRPEESEEVKVKRQRQEEKAKDKKTKITEGASILSSPSAVEGLRYRPSTRDTQRVYELLLSFITGCLGSQPQDILCGAADEVLDILKDDKLKVNSANVFLMWLLSQSIVLFIPFHSILCILTFPLCSF